MWCKRVPLTKIQCIKLGIILLITAAWIAVLPWQTIRLMQTIQDTVHTTVQVALQSLQKIPGTGKASFELWAAHVSDADHSIQYIIAIDDNNRLVVAGHNNTIDTEQFALIKEHFIINPKPIIEKPIAVRLPFYHGEKIVQTTMVYDTQITFEIGFNHAILFKPMHSFHVSYGIVSIIFIFTVLLFIFKLYNEIKHPENMSKKSEKTADASVSNNPISQHNNTIPPDAAQTTVRTPSVGQSINTEQPIINLQYRPPNSVRGIVLSSPEVKADTETVYNNNTALSRETLPTTQAPPVSKPQFFTKPNSNYISSLMDEKKKLTEEVENLSAYREVGLAIASILDFNEMLHTILEVVQHKLEVNTIYIYLTDEHGHFIPEIARCNEQTLSRSELGSAPFRDDAIHDALTYNMPVLISDSDGEQAILAPLLVNNTTIGILKIADKKKGDFADHDEALISLLTTQISLAINNARLYEMAITDGLTHLYVHRHFQHKLKEEILRAHRQQTPLTLIMTDIDHFKRFNDNYGHQTGDYVLAETASLVRKFFRNTDSAYRYGGEEFAVLLPDTSLETAYRLAEELREEIAGHVFHDDHGNDLYVTISLGIASWIPENQKDKCEVDYISKKIIKQTDESLYQSKAAGRNCTTCYSEMAVSA